MVSYPVLITYSTGGDMHRERGIYMNFIRELEEGIRRNSFEDHDSSLDDFPYMSGYLQSTENKKIMIYRWNEKKNRNERIWVDKDEI